MGFENNYKKGLNNEFNKWASKIQHDYDIKRINLFCKILNDIFIGIRKCKEYLNKKGCDNFLENVIMKYLDGIHDPSKLYKVLDCIADPSFNIDDVLKSDNCAHQMLLFSLPENEMKWLNNASLNTERLRLLNRLFNDDNTIIDSYFIDSYFPNKGVDFKRSNMFISLNALIQNEIHVEKQFLELYSLKYNIFERFVNQMGGDDFKIDDNNNDEENIMDYNNYTLKPIRLLDTDIKDFHPLTVEKLYDMFTRSHISIYNMYELIKEDLIIQFAFNANKTLLELKNNNNNDFTSMSQRDDDYYGFIMGESSFSRPFSKRPPKDVKMFYALFKKNNLENHKLIINLEKLLYHYSRLNDHVSNLKSIFSFRSEKIIVTALNLIEIELLKYKNTLFSVNFNEEIFSKKKMKRKRNMGDDDDDDDDDDSGGDDDDDDDSGGDDDDDDGGDEDYAALSISSSPPSPSPPLSYERGGIQKGRKKNLENNTGNKQNKENRSIKRKHPSKFSFKNNEVPIKTQKRSSKGKGKNKQKKLKTDEERNYAFEKTSPRKTSNEALFTKVASEENDQSNNQRKIPTQTLKESSESFSLRGRPNVRDERREEFEERSAGNETLKNLYLPPPPRSLLFEAGTSREIPPPEHIYAEIESPFGNEIRPSHSLSSSSLVANSGGIPFLKEGLSATSTPRFLRKMATTSNEHSLAKRYNLSYDESPHPHHHPPPSPYYKLASQKRHNQSKSFESLLPKQKHFYHQQREQQQQQQREKSFYSENYPTAPKTIETQSKNLQYNKKVTPRTSLLQSPSSSIPPAPPPPPLSSPVPIPPPPPLPPPNPPPTAISPLSQMSPSTSYSLDDITQSEQTSKNLLKNENSQLRISDNKESHRDANTKMSPFTGAIKKIKKFSLRRKKNKGTSDRTNVLKDISKFDKSNLRKVNLDEIEKNKGTSDRTNVLKDISTFDKSNLKKVNIVDKKEKTNNEPPILKGLGEYLKKIYKAKADSDSFSDHSQYVSENDFS
ncbi:UNVERIFIED_CONTAM: hypothetical protein RMT77_019323 [Armadillidium vulgare]